MSSMSSTTPAPFLRGGSTAAPSVLEKHAVEKTTPKGFYPRCFLYQRPVINLKSLNKFVHTEHFKMEGIHVLRDLLRAGDG
jgi:hypothetical protein